jgi:hypothetical protein
MQLTQEHVRIINDIRKDGGMRPITPECAQILFDQLSGEAQGEIMGRVLDSPKVAMPPKYDSLTEDILKSAQTMVRCLEPEDGLSWAQNLAIHDFSAAARKSVSGYMKAVDSYTESVYQAFSSASKGKL